MKHPKKYRTICFLLMVLFFFVFCIDNLHAGCVEIITNPVITKTNATCNNSNGSASIVVTNFGGTAPYSLTLNGQSNSTGIFTGLGAGKYLLRVTDAAGCKDSIFIVISSTGGIISPSIDPISPTTCNGGDGKIIVSNASGTGPYTYSLVTTGASGTSNTSGFTFNNVPLGTHSVIMTDGSGCRFTIDGLTVSNVIKPGGSCNAGQDATIFEGESAFIGGAADGIISWDPPDYLSDTTITNPYATPPAGIHKYTMHALNAATCSDCSDEVIITVLKEISPPNTFTPNGDGVNDVWQILGLAAYEDCELWIYSRWGERILHQKGYATGSEWNGTNNGLEIPAATYYYVIDIKRKDIAGKPKKYAGSITIVK